MSRLDLFLKPQEDITRDRQSLKEKLSKLQKLYLLKEEQNLVGKSEESSKYEPAAKAVVDAVGGPSGLVMVAADGGTPYLVRSMKNLDSLEVLSAKELLNLNNVRAKLRGGLTPEVYPGVDVPIAAKEEGVKQKAPPPDKPDPSPVQQVPKHEGIKKEVLDDDDDFLAERLQDLLDASPDEAGKDIYSKALDYRTRRLAKAKEEEEALLRREQARASLAFDSDSDTGSEFESEPEYQKRLTKLRDASTNPVDVRNYNALIKESKEREAGLPRQANDSDAEEESSEEQQFGRMPGAMLRDDITNRFTSQGARDMGFFYAGDKEAQYILFPAQPNKPKRLFMKIDNTGLVSTHRATTATTSEVGFRRTASKYNYIPLTAPGSTKGIYFTEDDGAQIVTDLLEEKLGLGRKRGKKQVTISTPKKSKRDHSLASVIQAIEAGNDSVDLLNEALDGLSDLLDAKGITKKDHAKLVKRLLK